MARVLVATPEPIARRLAGPAIRAAQIARVLGESHEVTLVSLAGESTSPIDGRPVLGPQAIDAGYDAAVIQGKVLIDHRGLHESNMPIAIDWFDPFHVEALHRGGADRIRRIDLIEGARSTLVQQAQRGDFFICSNPTQREHWLGWLAAAGRLNVYTHDEDPLFESLIAVAPFGVGGSPSGNDTPLRDEFSVIGPHDPIVLWAGGLHDWLDPLAVIGSMPTVLDENPDTRLVFLAGPHPNTSLETMGVRGEAIARASEMKLFGRNVLFVNRWVDYAERLAWLRDASIGVVADAAHLESRYSHRTRLLDHLAAGLPTVSTAGDPLSAQLGDAGAAVTVERGGDLLGLAIASLVNDEDRLGQMSAAANELAKGLAWETTLAPLASWLDDPKTAIDRRSGSHVSPPAAASTVARIGHRVRLHLEEGGARQVAQRGVTAARRRLGR